jgi:hypothetical protein
MKLKLFAFYFSDGSKLTERWHDGGAAVVSASSLEEAKKQLSNVDWECLDEVKEIGSTGSEICLIFPNAGCC